MIGHGPVYGAAVVDGNRTGRAFEPLDLGYWKRCRVFIAYRARPGAIGSVLVKERPSMAPGENAHGPHFIVHVVKVNPNRQWREVCVRPELNVLVPFDLFAAVRPFVIQFAVMEAHGTTQDRLSERCGWALKGELPKGVVMIYG